ncbi:hypothetical protein SteCoe_9458 [Stentor coeruleus]|uniref:Uncharacterized protein n=1 Tax=Stentor coeruleus TaxID=5963 RepID=A0A1R2CHX7_9CILI|nr:hypothetical protein SteCoe_9458 [Stentor coeruleus]
MIRLPKEKEEDFGISPWENSPGRNTKNPTKDLKSKIQEAPKTAILPYRPRTIQSRYSNHRKNSSVVQNIIFDAPATNIGFPKRILKSPVRFVKKSIFRSRSCMTDNLSICDIENIERVQQLKPFKPSVIYHPRINGHRRSITGTSPQDSLLSLGIIKEANYTHVNYRKYTKQSNL